MTEKEIFIENFKKRTKRFAVDVILFTESLKPGKASDIVTYQLVKAATSTGANYRAACRARSKADFFNKICIVDEEADESTYWLEVIQEAKLSKNENGLLSLLNEASEISRIVGKAKDTSFKK